MCRNLHNAKTLEDVQWRGNKKKTTKTTIEQKTPRGEGRGEEEERGKRNKVSAKKVLPKPQPTREGKRK